MEDKLGGEHVTLRRNLEGFSIQNEYTLGKQAVVPFKAGQKLNWSIVYK